MPSCSRFHPPLGWCALVKGEGHRRYPARWLARGPWRTVRGNNDVTLVQFHDLQARPRDALEQAIPGIDWWWNGCARDAFRTFQSDLTGRYDASSRTHEITVGEQELTHRDMFEAYQGLSKTRIYAGPVDQVSYLFNHRRQAEQHLDRLWHYGMQVWTLDESGSRLRLDADYESPPFEPPEWVKELEAREQSDPGCNQ